ncbi:hypothetical protein F5148DRAFT_1244628 [Russula earlei]|uniref:Uncharacterized protein n=1 Tax=Russula earlei TaxID=71964 RepID=A0ACC0TV13_9AGAM|nr:hypothetical protein F5148DRAFT_1244628 [Russula earlei]
MRNVHNSQHGDPRGAKIRGAAVPTTHSRIRRALVISKSDDGVASLVLPYIISLVLNASFTCWFLGWPPITGVLCAWSLRQRISRSACPPVGTRTHSCQARGTAERGGYPHPHATSPHRRNANSHRQVCVGPWCSHSPTAGPFNREEGIGAWFRHTCSCSAQGQGPPTTDASQDALGSSPAPKMPRVGGGAGLARVVIGNSQYVDALMVGSACEPHGCRVMRWSRRYSCRGIRSAL